MFGLRGNQRCVSYNIRGKRDIFYNILLMNRKLSRSEWKDADMSKLHMVRKCIEYSLSVTSKTGEQSKHNSKQYFT